MTCLSRVILSASASFLFVAFSTLAHADVGVGAKPIEGAEMLIDGTREMLDDKWIYWEGPGFKSAMPIKWPRSIR